MSVERRYQHSFPLAFRLRYSVLGIEGEGCTLNISSRSALIDVARNLPRGRRIDLFVEWPVKLDDRIPLRLVIRGTILRQSLQGTVIAFLRYEFRTYVGRTQCR